MSKSGFSLSSVLNWLSSFLKSMPSPVSGFDLTDAKVKEDGDIFSSYFSFESSNLKDERTGEDIADIGGNKIELSVLLKAINGKDVISPIVSDIVQLNSPEAFEQNIGLLDFLLGEGREDNEFHQNNGLGFLGIDLTKKESYNKDFKYLGQNWNWSDLAYNSMKYSLECMIPDENYGAIENVDLMRCSDLISEYLVKTNVITVANEVQVDANVLVTPILVRVQDALAEYYMAAYKKVAGQTQEGEEVTLEDLMDNSADNQQGENGQTADQGANAQTGTQTPTNQSKQISVKLKKITGSTNVDVLALGSNYSPADTLDDLEDILIQDEFMNNLTEEPRSFEIDVDDDGYDIAQCDDCEIDPCDSLGYLMTQGIMFYRNLYVLHWMAKGNDMMKLHLMTEELYEELIKEIDTLGELMVEKCGTVIDPNFTYSAVEIRPYEFQEGLYILKGYINSYINFIDYAYINQSSDVQSIMDEWLRFWNKQVNYFIKQQKEV